MVPMYDAHFRTFSPRGPTAFDCMVIPINPWVTHDIPISALGDGGARIKGILYHNGLVNIFGENSVIYDSLIPRDGRGDIKDGGLASDLT